MAENVRKLATILSVDIAGYSRAMAKDDAGAAAAVVALRERASIIAEALGGRIFSTAGDGMMLEFPSATAGLKAAQGLLDAVNAPNTPAPKIRIGVHLGEVIVAANGDLLGHGVNVAARIQALAEPGAALASEAVRAQARAGFEAAFIPQGRVPLEKMDESIAVYAFGAKTAAAASPFAALPFAGGLTSKITRQRLSKYGWIAALAAVVLVLGVYAFWPKAKTKPVLAVLPFAAEAETPAARAFANGFTTELHDVLSRGAADLTLIGFATSSGLASDPQRVRILHDQTGATYILDGAILRAGDDIEASVSLLDARSGAQIWRDRFSDRFANLYPLQVRIAKRMREVLRLSSDAGDAAAINPDALRLYMAALGADTALPGPAGMRDRIETLKRAVAIQPDFTQAWRQLTFAYSHYRYIAPTQAEREAARAAGQTAAKRYLALSPNDARAHYWSGEFEVDPQKRAAFLSEALRLGRQDPDVLSQWSALLMGVGRTQDAYRMASQAAALDPYSDFVISRKIWRALGLADLTEAEDALRDARLLVRAPAARWYHVVIGWLAQGEVLRATAALPALEEAAAIAANSQRGNATDQLDASGAALLVELARAAVAAQSSAPARRRASALVDMVFAENERWPVDSWFGALAFVSVVESVDRAFALWEARLRANPPLAVSGVAPDRETGAAYLSWANTSLARLHSDPRIFAFLARYPILRNEPFPNEEGAMASMLTLMKQRPPDFCSTPDFPYDCKAAIDAALSPPQ